MATSSINCRRAQWKGRPGYCLNNGRVQMTALTGGGAMADLRCRCGADEWSPNLLWEAPWPTMDPDRFQRRHSRQYGPPFVGKFLAGFTGHTLCLDYFGAPSEDEICQGLCLHGEASVIRWKVRRASRGQITMEARLPVAGLDFRREMSVLRGETVIYVRETVSNPKPTDHFLHWVQHVTLGPPFLQGGDSTIAIPAVRGKTWPHGYKGKSLLANDREFEWPFAPSEGGGRADLSKPFIQAGTGLVAAVLFDCNRSWAYVAVLNFRLGLLLGFCFQRSSYPWATLWEENCARDEVPWNAKTLARGIEFGTTPFPVGRQSAFAMGNLFGVPTFARVPARGKIHANYAIFMTPVSRDWREIREVKPEDRSMVIVAGNGDQVRVPARGLSRIGPTGMLSRNRGGAEQHG
jgi:hypothetical protein